MIQKPPWLDMMSTRGFDTAGKSPAPFGTARRCAARCRIRVSNLYFNGSRMPPSQVMIWPCV